MKIRLLNWLIPARQTLGWVKPLLAVGSIAAEFVPGLVAAGILYIIGVHLPWWETLVIFIVTVPLAVYLIVRTGEARLLTNISLYVVVSILIYLVTHPISILLAAVALAAAAIIARLRLSPRP